MSEKPLVFNYGHYETLRDKCNDMAIEIEELKKKNEEQMFTIMRLKEENTDLKLEVEKANSEVSAAEHIIDIQNHTIQTWHQTFKLQEEELKRLRTEVSDV